MFKPILLVHLFTISAINLQVNASHSMDNISYNASNAPVRCHWMLMSSGKFWLQLKLSDFRMSFGNVKSRMLQLRLRYCDVIVYVTKGHCENIHLLT